MKILIDLQSCQAHDDILIKLPDEFTDADLTKALEKLKEDVSLRQCLGKSAKNYIETKHSVNMIAKQYYNLIESNI